MLCLLEILLYIWQYIMLVIVYQSREMLADQVYLDHRLVSYAECGRV